MELGKVDDVDALVGRYIARLRDQIPITAAYIFGSYAHGGATPESDVDVAVVSPAFGRSYHQDLLTLSRARVPDASIISALPFTPEELQSPPRGSFLREIIKTGRRVA